MDQSYLKIDRVFKSFSKGPKTTEVLADIRLTIDYSYQSASDHVRNSLRLLPSDGPNQRILSRLLTITPAPDERRDGVDFFGNATTAIAWHDPIDTITLHLRNDLGMP